MNKSIKILVVSMLLFLVGCDPTPPSHQEAGWTEYMSGRFYQIVYIEGMPCLQTDSVGGAITCDWSKWDGNK
jgi:hypothetical protein